MGSELFDGTQPLEPQAVYPDPLSGLVTGETGEYSGAPRPEEAVVSAPGWLFDENNDAQRFLFEDDDEFDSGRPPAARATSGFGQGAAQTPGMLPVGPPSDRPSTRQRVRKALRTPAYPRRNGSSQAGDAMPRKRKLSGGSGGVILAIVLIVLFGVVAIQIIAGIIEAISGTVD